MIIIIIIIVTDRDFWECLLQLFPGWDGGNRVLRLIQGLQLLSHLDDDDDDEEEEEEEDDDDDEGNDDKSLLTMTMMIICWSAKTAATVFSG